jgi:hypothetical protein
MYAHCPTGNRFWWGKATCAMHAIYEKASCGVDQHNSIALFI